MFNKPIRFTFSLFLCLILRGSDSDAQNVLSVKIFKKNSLERVRFDTVYNKTIPDKFALQIKTAFLSAPTKEPDESIQLNPNDFRHYRHLFHHFYRDIPSF